MKIYFVGICGVMMAPLAVSMQEKGHEVEGSDKGFYPPISTYLQEHNIPIKVGFKTEHITGDIDIAVVGPAILQNNVEYLKIKELGIKHFVGYAGFIEEYVLKPQSIVAAGTYGKTTISSFISLLLEKAGMHPTFAIGGIPLNFSDGVRITDSDWSVIEGDEYINSRVDPVAKFLYYHPSIFIINAAKYDHIDIYKSEDEYINAYRKGIELMHEDGSIFVNKHGDNIDKVTGGFEDSRKIFVVNTDIKDPDREVYASLIDYIYEAHGIRFRIQVGEQHYEFFTSIIGIHNIQNLVMGIAVGMYLDIDMEILQSTVEEFKGVRRRLEIRKEKPYIVIDDLAHSPIKAAASIAAVKERFPHQKIMAVFEPHTLSSRLKDSLEGYTGYFDDADKIYVAPVYHPDAVPEDSRVTSNDIAQAIGHDACGFDTFDALKQEIESEINEGDILLFMSSGNFGGLINYFSSAN